MSLLRSLSNIITEGELVDLIDEFSDGRIQFAYVKVKDPNTGLPKNALIAWCGEGVPERTKGYFTSHLAAVSKLLHVRRLQTLRPYVIETYPLSGLPCSSHRSIRPRFDARRNYSEDC
jgi:Cofilin/tropomyosin-type actin-binding protein